MENPNTWTHTQKVIADALLDYQEKEKLGQIGYSLATTIYKALVKHDLLKVCSKCSGYGWLWWNELDNYNGPAVQTGEDDTKYSCDACRNLVQFTL